MRLSWRWREDEAGTDDGAAERPDQQGDGHGAPAEEGADHGEQLDVAAAHSLASGDAVVPFGDGPQDPAAEQDAEQRRLPAGVAASPRRREADDDAGQADGVGDDLMIEVDEGDDDQGAEEGEGDGQSGRQPKWRNAATAAMPVSASTSG